MEEILKPDKSVMAAVRQQKLKDIEEYKRTIFLFPFQIENKHYLFNTLTKQCFFAENNEYKKYMSQDTFSPADIEDSRFLTKLMENHFLVPVRKSEEAYYVSVINLLRNINRKDGYTLYTILPTTACNARCFYCYEQGMKTVTMDDEKTAQTVSFILATHANEEITLNWFGGEPLIGEKTITKICTGLKQKNIKFKSIMVSNGSLISEDMADDMVNIWNLKNVQISMDGAEDEYNRAKHYITPFDSAYKTVLDNIHTLLNKGVGVKIRCNVSQSNIDTLEEFADDLISDFHEELKPMVYFTPIFEIQEAADGVNTWDRCFDIQQKLKNAGFGYYHQSDMRHTLLHFCMHDSKYGILIAPDGSLYSCDHYEGHTPRGNIQDAAFDKRWDTPGDFAEPVSQKCIGCRFIPICTSFTGCSLQKSDCVGLNAKQALVSLTNIIT